jgi:uncharacterized cupredoxin-like copper-binding protein
MGPVGTTRSRVPRVLAALSLLIAGVLLSGAAVMGASQATIGPATAGACPSPTMLAGTELPATEIPTTTSATESAYQTAAAKTYAVTQKGTRTSTEQAAGASTAQATRNATTASQASCTTMEVAITVRSFAFNPNKIAIPANTDVRFTFNNPDRIEHSFVIQTEQVHVEVMIAPGGTAQTTLNLHKGTYEFYCIVPGHKAQGMVGELIVG